MLTVSCTIFCFSFLPSPPPVLKFLLVFPACDLVRSNAVKKIAVITKFDFFFNQSHLM